MNRENVSEKSRKQNTHEGMRNAQSKGREVANLAFMIGIMVIMFFNAWRKEYNDQVGFLLWIYLAAESWPKYQFTKKKVYLLSIAAFAFAACINLYTLVLCQ